MTIDIDELVPRMRILEIDHEPDGWPAIRMRDVSALCDALYGLVPSLDRLQERLEAGATIHHQDNRWRLFDKSGDCITSGATVRNMLVNLIFSEC